MIPFCLLAKHSLDSARLLTVAVLRLVQGPLVKVSVFKPKNMDQIDSSSKRHMLVVIARAKVSFEAPEA